MDKVPSRDDVRRPRIAFVHNFASHYTVGAFELLAREFDVDFFFYSGGDESYWLKEHGVRAGDFRHQYLRGFSLGGTRVVPSLPSKLLRADYDLYITCIDGRFTVPVTYFAARLRGKPFLVWTGIWSRIDTPFHRLVFPIVRRLYRSAEAVVVYGEHVKRYLQSEGILVANIFVAPHAVDNRFCQRYVSQEERLSLRDSLGVSKGQKVVLFLGRLEALKGVEYLIDGFASLRRNDAELVLAGTGSAENALRLRVRDRGIETLVRFPGYVPQRETTAYYAVSDVFVVPSISTPTWKEPWGLTVNEALNQGVPVIATASVGAAAGGLLRDGYNGYIVPERDSGAIAAALTRVLNDAEHRQQLSAGALESIALWDHNHMVAGFRKAIEHALAEPRRG
jgi:glycosyltransferase involved in cell wall biosynthesis